MRAFEGLNVYYRDLHNHCGISYGHGSLKQALDNARQQLDFCSVTGHAIWPDMPEPDDDIQTIVDYHLKGFAHLRACWPEVLQTIEAYNQPGVFVTFPSFEMHSCADGDYTILYGDASGELLSADGWPAFVTKCGSSRAMGARSSLFHTISLITADSEASTGLPLKRSSHPSWR